MLVTIIAFKTWKQFSLNFSEGNLATKQVIFLQRPVMWSSAVQTPEVSDIFVPFNILKISVSHKGKIQKQTRLEN